MVEVIGVNVATSGNQISFPGTGVPFAKTDGQPRHLTQSKTTSSTLKRNCWPTRKINSTGYWNSTGPNKRWDKPSSPAKSASTSIAGGETQDKQDLTYKLTSTRCSSNDSIYISRNFTTGAMDYEFYWLESDELNSLRFHQLYSSNISSMYAGNRANKDSVTNYQCHQDFTANQADNDNDGVWKSTFCARRYKKYPQLYDVIFISAYIGDERAGLVSHFSLSGISRDKARQFTRAFMESYQWQ